MLALGIALLVAGTALVAVEMHVPNGAAGTLGGIALLVGGIVALFSLGAGAAIAVPVGLILGLCAGGWTLSVGRQIGQTRGLALRSGIERLAGRVGEVRQWKDDGGQIYIDGALWRARIEDISQDADHELVPFERGDHVVVEYSRGLTLCVRRAEQWELIQ
jgi:membrane-bound serine protease (ClpP class)